MLISAVTENTLLNYWIQMVMWIIIKRKCSLVFAIVDFFLKILVKFIQKYLTIYDLMYILLPI